MRTITKIACRTIGAAGLGTALYNASRVSSLFAKNEGLYENQKHLEKAFFDSRTIDSVNYTRNSIREKTFDLRSKNPLPTIMGNIKGGIKGFLYGLGDTLPVVICSSLALVCKNIFAKLGAIGVGLALCYSIARDGFGLGKHHPMN